MDWRTAFREEDGQNEVRQISEITKKHRWLMEHSLGGKDPAKWYRNYFVASSGHKDLPNLIELEKHGMMKRVQAPSFCSKNTIVFVVTDAGKTFLSDESKKTMKRNG